MANTVQQTVRAGRTYEVTVSRLREKAAEAERGRFSAFGPLSRPEAQSGIPRVRPLDAGTFLGLGSRTPGDALNVFRALDLETGLVPSTQQLYNLTRAEIAATNTDEPSTYLYSDRPLAARCAPVPVTSELDGHVLGIDLRSAATARHPTDRLLHWELFQTAPWVRRMRTRSEQIAMFDKLRNALHPGSRLTLQEAVDRADALDREQFDAPTNGRARHDLVTCLPAGPGLWQMGVTCPVYYYPWNMWTPERFKVTEEDFYHARDATWSFPVGIEQGYEIKLFLVPQRQITYFQWFALYTLAGFLVPAIQVFIPNTKVFVDRLPYWPYPYAYAAAGDQPSNDTAMSLHIQQKRMFGLALEEDRAIEFFSWYVALVLELRVEGRWTILRGREYEGDLRGVVEYRTASGRKKRAYIWNRVTTGLARELFGFGALDLQPLVYPVVRGMYPFNFSPGIGPIA